MVRLLLVAILLSAFFGCARYQDTQFTLSPINDVPRKYRVGNLESKHSKELHEFIRSNYGAFLTENEDAPVINANQILFESKTEGTGRVESWGYFAAFREQEDSWGIGPAELEAEERALSSAINETILKGKQSVAWAPTSNR